MWCPPCIHLMHGRTWKDQWATSVTPCSTQQYPLQVVEGRMLYSGPLASCTGAAQEVTEQFGGDLERIAAGEYDSWMHGGPLALLAGVVLMDQFSRWVMTVCRLPHVYKHVSGGALVRAWADNGALGLSTRSPLTASSCARYHGTSATIHDHVPFKRAIRPVAGTRTAARRVPSPWTPRRWPGRSTPWWVPYSAMPYNTAALCLAVSNTRSLHPPASFHSLCTATLGRNAVCHAHMAALALLAGTRGGLRTAWAALHP